ncbi:hypothetical protein Tco_0574659, partial [Tanacetum coccineum]
MVDRGIFDSRCSGHMICNKDQLEDFEEFNGGSVTFGGSKGYITDRGKRYKRRKISKVSAGTGLDFEEVKSAFKEVNTGGIKVSA